jgi:hypothetical protein
VASDAQDPILARVRSDRYDALMTPAFFLSWRFLNILGLAISLVAAFMMCSFPLSANAVFREKKTGKWHEVGGFYGNPVVPWWKVWRARLGPILLGAGFFLQIVAAANV